MTVVDQAFSELPDGQGSFKMIPVGINAPLKAVRASKGVLMKRLGGRRSRSASNSSVSHATTSVSRIQKQRQSCFSSRPLARKLDKKVEKIVRARVESEPSRSAVNAGNGDAHVDVDPSSGHKLKSQIPRGQPFGMAEPADALREFCTTIPETLRRSVAFQNTLKRAVKKALDREATLR
jgi:hypothetical protein